MRLSRSQLYWRANRLGLALSIRWSRRARRDGYTLYIETPPGERPIGLLGENYGATADQIAEYLAELEPAFRAEHRAFAALRKALEKVERCQRRVEWAGRYCRWRGRGSEKRPAPRAGPLATMAVRKVEDALVRLAKASQEAAALAEKCRIHPTGKLADMDRLLRQADRLWQRHHEQEAKRREQEAERVLQERDQAAIDQLLSEVGGTGGEA